MKFHTFLPTVVFLASCSRAQISLEEDSDVPTCAEGFHGPSYILFTRDIPGGQVVKQDDTDIPLDKRASTAFIAHGFTEIANSTDYIDMVSAWLAYEKMNIFLVQWDDDSCSIGGNSTTQHKYASVSISYVPKLGELVARFTKKLIEKHHVSIRKTRLVGHSLGAQLVGYAAKFAQTLGLGKYKEIIALDPAGLFVYAGAPCSERVCITDAHFLVLFHTTANPGTYEPQGNIDFYFNGGVSQPGCNDAVVSDCSHGRSKKYFTESIRNIGNRKCMFLGRPYHLNTNTTIEKSECTEETCNLAGLQSIRNKARGTFYVKTLAEPPYCLD